MSIREVIRFVCDEPQCSDLPCMTEQEAIAHAELHKEESSLNVEKIEAYLWAQL
jgi:hypothetical protein